MSEVENKYYIGWDVGAWSCNANKNSCDAIVMLDSEKKIVGSPWRDSLNKIIFGSETVEDFVREIFKVCGRENLYSDEIDVVIGIDAVLGFSESLRSLINERKSTGKGLDEHQTNSYLFRQTELFLFEKKHSPLSALTHMIGSQATKAMHVVAKFSKDCEEVGVWKSKLGKVKFIETYPATCGEAYDKECEDQFEKPEEKIKGQKISKPEYARKDKADAYKCARVAYEFCRDRSSLYEPKDSDKNISLSEGWIWALKN